MPIASLAGKALVALLLMAAGPPTSPGGGIEPGLREALALERARPRAPLHPRDAFLKPDALADVQIAPDGSAVAFLRRKEQGHGLWLAPAGGGAPRQLLRHTEGVRLRWSANSRWVFVESERRLLALSLHAERGAGLLSLIGGTSRREVIGADPVDPAAVIVRETVEPAGAAGRPTFRLLRLRPARPAQQLMRSHDLITDATFAPSGRMAFALLTRADHHAILAFAPSGGAREVRRCVRLETCALISSPDPRTLFISSDIGGDLRRLLRIGVDGRISEVHADPTRRYDLADVAVDPGNGRPLVARYRSGAARDYGLTREASAALAAIALKLGHRQFDAMPARAASGRWLVRDGDDRRQQAVWHLFDANTARLTPLLPDQHRGRPALAPSTLARRIAFSWRSSDGMLLHGFLAVPPGIDPRRAPLIVQVHGGPWAHAAPGYGAIAQFLANRGFIVFEPNFRGSTGHGRRYMVAGKTDFADGRVQRDIDEGARTLLAAGIGDPRRVAITGVSFGGYATLAGLTFSPDLYKVGIAAVPPPDFGWVMRWQAARQDAERRPGIRLGTSLRLLSLDPADPRIVGALSEGSPRAHAARLSRPLLLIAGGKDTQVPLRSVTSYAAQLKSMGKDVSLFVDPQSGHRITGETTQGAYLYLLEAMLAEHLGSARPNRPSGEVRQSIARNLRLRGTAFVG